MFRFTAIGLAVATIFALPSYAQSPCDDLLIFEGISQNPTICEYFGAAADQNVVPFIFLSEDDDDDDCPDDGDPTLQCNPTFIVMPDREFMGLLTMSNDGFGFREITDDNLLDSITSTFEREGLNHTSLTAPSSNFPLTNGFDPIHREISDALREHYPWVLDHPRDDFVPLLIMR